MGALQPYCDTIVRVPIRPSIPAASCNLERLVIIMYDKSSPLDSVNETRMNLFCKHSRAIGNLPPTQNGLLKHVERAVLQAGIWTTSDASNQDIPYPDRFGWKIGDTWKPVWITIPEVSKACQELIKCSCI
ncbi:uncharacterized protein [Montipora capricornis]|uniref:uncharacterized protein n=1 Tax=Montipora capricornis TaxID=246305 RepID=UPI0035F1B86F